MNFVKRFFDFILFGNIYVALGAVCLAQSTVIQLKFTDHLFPYSFLVFFATLFVYNFQRIFYKPPQDSSLNSIRRKWIFKNKITVKLLILGGFIGVVITFFFNDHLVFFYLSPLLILSLMYFVPQIKLRKNSLLKLLTLVIVWTAATAVMPILLINSGPLINPEVTVLHIFVRFCFMIAICIPFDIRDLNIDKADSISTIPDFLGENIAKWLAFGFMLLYIILIIPEFILGIIDSKIFIALMFSAVINTVIVLMSSSKRDEYFYVAGIDGTMILQGVLLMIVSYL